LERPALEPLSVLVYLSAMISKKLILLVAAAALSAMVVVVVVAAATGRADCPPTPECPCADG
jgi:hypothetical protein